MPPPLRPAYYELAMAGLLAEMTGVELVGATVELDLHELAAAGPALVVVVRPCPAIPAGPGQVVTATFKHASADVVDLVLSDYPVNSPGTPDDVAFSSSPSAISPSTSDANPSAPETIGVTGNHPFWSLDRLEFVQVGELVIGERLQTLSGDIKWVQQKLPRPGPEPVYNLEVHGEHVYYAGTDGVLVHNSCLTKELEYSSSTARTRLNSSLGGTVGDVLDAHHIIPWVHRTHDILKRAARGGFNINGANNGILLSPGIHQATRYHPLYNKAIGKKLDRMSKDLAGKSDAEVAQSLQAYADQLRVGLARLQKGLN